MRIIAGKLKGARLETPDGATLRPTQDRVREAIFSTLQSYVDWSRTVVIDLYAGSGALGLEAISRGARRALFVEADGALVSALRQSINRLGVEAQARVLPGELPAAWREAIAAAAVREGEEELLVFLDPPYRQDAGAQMLQTLLESESVPAESLIVVESEAGAALLLEGTASRAEIVKERSYGATQICYVRTERKSS